MLLAFLAGSCCAWTAAPTVFRVESLVPFALARAPLSLVHAGPGKTSKRKSAGQRKSSSSGFAKKAAAAPPVPVPPPNATPIPALDADAAALLEEAGGDVAKAKTSYIGYTLAYLENEMPELYEGLKTDPSRSDCHAALVELTYDAVAAFLPVTHAPTPTPAAQKKLQAIARSSVDGNRTTWSILDVGCGTGLLLPFLLAAGAPPTRYRGIDISSRMIDRARADHRAPAFAGARFDAVSLETVAAEAAAATAGAGAVGRPGSSGLETEAKVDASRPYDVIIFDAALQFFPDTAGALHTAARLLSRGPHARLVIAHMQGAAFVRQEKEENPTVVRALMPGLRGPRGGGARTRDERGCPILSGERSRGDRCRDGGLLPRGHAVGSGRGRRGKLRFRLGLSDFQWTVCFWMRSAALQRRSAVQWRQTLVGIGSWSARSR
jgi:SAM-dependent methyltransferase